MQVLIVESNLGLGTIWRRHIERQGPVVYLATTQSEAIELLRLHDISILIQNLELAHGSAIAVADFASYRRPAAKVIFVTSSKFFSDGSIFKHIPNACAYVTTTTPPDDLAAMVEHYGGEADLIPFAKVN
jgi:DNA-binding response OmpR family regulator